MKGREPKDKKTQHTEKEEEEEKRERERKIEALPYSVQYLGRKKEQERERKRKKEKERERKREKERERERKRERKENRDTAIQRAVPALSPVVARGAERRGSPASFRPYCVEIARSETPSKGTMEALATMGGIIHL